LATRVYRRIRPRNAMIGGGSEINDRYLQRQRPDHAFQAGVLVQKAGPRGAVPPAVVRLERNRRAEHRSFSGRDPMGKRTFV